MIKGNKQFKCQEGELTQSRSYLMLSIEFVGIILWLASNNTWCLIHKTTHHPEVSVLSSVVYTVYAIDKNNKKT